MSMKFLLMPAGIEQATFRLLAQHLNHCVTAVPPCVYVCILYKNTGLDASVVYTIRL